MSDIFNIKKKRPPKLTPIVQQASVPNEEPNIATSHSVDLALGSFVKVNLDGIGEVSIGPKSLLVTKSLGRGQYGIVEEVLHLGSKFKFAVKRVSLRPSEETDRNRLLMDVDILVKSSECLNIIKFYGSFIWEGDLWILMELMDCSLDRFYKLAHRKVNSPAVNSIQDQHRPSFSLQEPCTHLSQVVCIGNCDHCNPIPEKVIGRMANDILNALNYLYSIKVIHRDIKPSNILINRAGLIKLCDFGISGYLINSVARTYDAGCRPYMAPERIDPPRDRSGYDIKSDVWSFGITLLEIAAGRYPYNHARGFFEQLKSICTDEPPKLPTGRFSPVFENFINSCLKKDYQARPKWDILQVHEFVMQNGEIDISKFTEKVLSLNSDT